MTALGTAGAVLLLPGCKTRDAVTPEVKPRAGVTLRIAAPADPALRALIQRHGRDWSDRSGGTLQLVAADADADVRVLHPAELGAQVARLAPLNLSPLKGMDGYEFSRLLRHEVERHMDWGGTPLALPLMGESLFCVYRADLLAEARHAAALNARFQQRFRHNLRATGPATWQEVAEIADYFANEPAWTAGEKSATPRPSLPPLPAAAEEFDRDFHALAACVVRRAVNQEKVATLNEKQRTELFFTYALDVDTGGAALASPGFVAALELLQRLQAFRPKGTSDRPLEAFRAGRAVFALATLADLAWLQGEGSPVRDRFTIGRVPGSDTIYDALSRKIGPAPDPSGNLVPYHGHGGWLGGIDAKANERDAALDFLTFLSSPQVSLEVACEPAWGGGPTRSSHIDNRSGWHNYGLSSAASGQLVAALDAYYRGTLLNPAYRLRIARQQEYVRTFADHIRPALIESRPAAAALQDAVKAWDALAKDRGALQREYRQSLGLK